jgi:hypothetical protein
MKVMLECNKHSPENKQQMKNLFDKYSPIERNRTIDHQTRCNHMLDWWTGDLEILK